MDVCVLRATANAAPGERALLERPRVRLRCAADGWQALRAVEESLPDLVLCDMTLPGLDAPALIRRVRELPVCRMPAVAVLTLPGMAPMDALVCREGAFAVGEKPLNEAFLARALDMGLSDRLPRRDGDLAAIRRTLWSLGFSARLRGTEYLALAADLASRDERACKRLTIELYPLVAGAFGVSRQQVEHGIRRAIESAWSGGNSEAQYALFGNTIDARRAKPTAGEMIARAAERLRAGLE